MLVLIERPNGTQKLIAGITPQARVATDAIILWDERVDGTFPSNMLTSIGGLERVNGALIVNATKLTAAQAAAATVATAKTQKEQRIAQAKQSLNQANLANGDPDLTPQQIRQLFRFIRVILKDVGNQLD